MNFDIPRRFIEELVNNFDSYNKKHKIEKLEEIDELFKKIKSDYLASWRRDEALYEFKENFFSTPILKILLEIASDEKISKGVIGGWKFKNHLTNYFSVLENPIGTKIKDLKLLPQAFKEYVKTSQHKFLFKMSEEGISMLPYYVSYCKYIPSTKNSYGVTPESVTINLAYIRGNKNQKTSIDIYNYDIVGGKEINVVLKSKDFYLETEEIYQDYLKELETYKSYSSQYGEQFLGRGKVLTENSWRSSYIYLNDEGERVKLIMDDFTEKEKFKVLETNYWSENKDKCDYIIPPFHPYVRCFNLKNHYYLTTHINNITPYIYNPKLGDKLILPEENKNLIDILTQSSASSIDDIIVGKTGGVIVLSLGLPGTGKTLTAEIYSEVIKRPLYVVQSAQLGVNIKELEDELKTVLNRAAKWKAILLIDEADVYISERGKDLVQNAIVGIFLRLLEYYKGILFFTSNRGQIIDDAILSRCTAIINYELPTADDAKKIFDVLTEQFKLKIKDEVIYEVINTFEISGRDIKHLLKLIKFVSERQNKEINYKLFEYCSKFLNIKKRDLL